MPQTAIKNEATKNNYFAYCRGAEGLTESTINKYAQCIFKWQTCFKEVDFTEINKEKCDEFKKFLKQEAEKNNTSLSNQYDILRHLKRFFLWLTEQKGYENVKKTDIAYLRLSKSETRIALERKDKETPSLKEIQNVVHRIQPTTEVDMRDRALVAFLILTGIRISALVSLPMQAFDPFKLLINQDPGLGVKTKNSKKILSTFLPIFWDEGERIFLDWYNHLKSKGFGPQKPIFPASKSLSLKSVSDKFWQTSGPVRQMIRERCKEAGVSYYNPHSFRHSAAEFMSERGLTEADKRAISLVFGHENVGTTFGTYGYGHISPADAVKRVREMRNQKEKGLTLDISDEDLGRIMREALSSRLK